MPRRRVTDYPEKYEVNEVTMRDYFYLHFGFYDDYRLYYYTPERSKYYETEVNTKLLSRGLQRS